MVEGKEGEGKGGTPHHHVHTNVGKFSRLFIFVIIKEITFKLGDFTTLKALSPTGPCQMLKKKNRERVFQQFIFVYSEAMTFTRYTFPVKPMNLS